MQLTLVGEGSQKTILKNSIQQLEIKDKVIFKGHIAHSNLPDTFREADAYISASLTDGSSVSLLEAMATGLPVAVSDIPGNREWVFPTKNGYLFNQLDTDDIAYQLINLATIPANKRLAIGKTNRAICESKADWNTNSHIITQGILSLAPNRKQ